MTRDEKNRKIAEALEPFNSLPQSSELGILDEIIHSPKRAWYYIRDKEHQWMPCNFYRSEEANALVRTEVLKNKAALQWLFDEIEVPGSSERWREQICEAYLAMLEEK